MHRFVRHQVGWLLMAALIVLGVFGVSRFVSSLASNVGLLLLTRTLVQHDVSAGTALRARELANADTWLRTATSLDAANQGAWRGLGFILAAQDQEKQAITAWLAAGLAGEDFVRFGEQQRQKHQYAEALRWLQRAAQVESGSATPWYYIGLAHEGLQQWEEAISAYRQALAQPGGEEVMGSVNLQLGTILQQHTQPADLAGALKHYEAALTVDHFVNSWERLDTHYYRGDVLRQQGRLAEALQEFKWVVTTAPDHYWGHMWLGLLTWQVDRNAQLAEQYLKTAAALKPEIKWSYRWLGDLYRQTGHLADAAQAYRHVLAIDPQDQAAQQFFLSQKNNAY